MKPIDGWPGYFVSSDGRIYSAKCGRFLICRPHQKTGYCYAILSNGKAKKLAVHRLVASAFLGGNRPDMVPNHKNSVRHDNRAENLEWATRSTNLLHGYREGKAQHRRGEGSHLAKLNNDDVRQIRELLKQGVVQQLIADQFGVSRSMISHIGSRKAWKHL